MIVGEEVSSSDPKLDLSFTKQGFSPSSLSTDFKIWGMWENGKYMHCKIEGFYIENSEWTE